MTGPERTRVWNLLRQGLGVEDVGVRLGADPDFIRGLVAYQRKQGKLYWLLGTDRQRNAEALAIMGVRPASQESTDA